MSLILMTIHFYNRNMTKFIALLFITVACSNLPPPQIISLNEPLIPSVTHKLAYDEVLIKASNFSVNQYHEGLKNLFAKNGTSLLCGPSTLATSFIEDFKSTQEGKSLKLDGVAASGASIDANLLVRQLSKCSDFTPENGANTANTSNCIVKIYQSAGLNYEVKIVTNLKRDLFKNLHDSVKTETREPHPNDIVMALNTDHHVIGLIDFFTVNKDNSWKVTDGHIIRINGYARRNKWPKDILNLYITDPVVSYSPSAYPRMHPTILSRSSIVKNLPIWTSEYFIEGAPFMGFYDRAFLSGLLIFKILPKNTNER
jgi:hypothetical protein